MTFIMTFLWAVSHLHLVFTYYEIMIIMIMIFFFLNIQGDPGKAGEAGSPGASGQRVSAIIVMATLKHTVIFHNKLL